MMNSLGAPSGGFYAAMLAALLWGLAGGFSHCIGMCGIFVLSAARIDEPSPKHRLARQLLFQSGRMTILVLLGAAAGEIGSLAGFAARFARAQGELSVACGILMTLLALGYVGILPKLRIPEPDVMGAGGGTGRRLFASALRSREWHQPLALGALVGLLPCGLTYTILIAAAVTLSAAKGAAVLLAFGLGTIPGLLTLGMAGHFLRNATRSGRLRLAMTRSGAVVMFVMGVLLIWRGWPNLF